MNTYIIDVTDHAADVEYCIVRAKHVQHLKQRWERIQKHHANPSGRWYPDLKDCKVELVQDYEGEVWNDYEGTISEDFTEDDIISQLVACPHCQHRHTVLHNEYCKYTCDECGRKLYHRGVVKS